MPDTDAIHRAFNKSERYIAFLLTELPRLKTMALHADCEEAPLEKREVLRTALDLVTDEGIGLEFGVYKGKSLRMMAAQRPEMQFYGFDSFEGFPDDGRPDWDQDFRVASLPRVPKNCTLIKGWFEDTLAPFLEEHPEPIAFIDIDCDIYSSTRTVLTTLKKAGRLQPGQIIYFDELINYATFPWHEMLALFELLEESGFGIRWLCVHKKVRMIDELLLLHRDSRFPKWRTNVKQGYQVPTALMLTDDGINYGPLDLPPFEKRVRELASLFDEMTKRFEAGIIRHDTHKPPHERLRLFIKHRFLRRNH